MCTTIQDGEVDFRAEKPYWNNPYLDKINLTWNIVININDEVIVIDPDSEYADLLISEIVNINNGSNVTTDLNSDYTD